MHGSLIEKEDFLAENDNAHMQIMDCFISELKFTMTYSCAPGSPVEKEDFLAEDDNTKNKQ